MLDYTDTYTLCRSVACGNCRANSIPGRHVTGNHYSFRKMAPPLFRLLYGYITDARCYDFMCLTMYVRGLCILQAYRVKVTVLIL